MAQQLPFYTLFKLLQRHRKLAERRDPMFYTNKVAKRVIAFVMGLVGIYLLMFAILLAFDANSSHSYTTIEYIFGILPLILTLDFGVRFLVQQTPSHIVKPYVLLPLPRYACIDCFIINSLMGWGNLLWFGLLVPYCLMSVVFAYGIFPTLSLLLLYYICILANSQWYSICRTLIVGSQLWWALPLLVYLGVYSIWIVGDFSIFFNCYSAIGKGLEHGNVLPHVIALSILVALSLVNRRLQYNNVWREMGKQQAVKLKRVSRFSALNHLGEMGEYMKIEIKSLMRNKNPRKSFIFATVIVLMLSLVISFTDVYDSTTMANFWCFYNFVIYGAMMLIRVMSYEANYIDALMVHKENILKLLMAKYYFFCALLLFPFILMLPMVVLGKWQLLMLLSYGIFTAGFQYFILMQLAVYNKQKLPLNEAFISKSGVESNYLLLIVELSSFIIPMILISLLETIFPHVVAWLVIMAIGIGFIACHKLWLRNIYRRLMQRRYDNLIAFRA